jgi:hypothetical protein
MSIGVQIFTCQMTTEFATDHFWRKAAVHTRTACVPAQDIEYGQSLRYGQQGGTIPQEKLISCLKHLLASNSF